MIISGLLFAVLPTLITLMDFQVNCFAMKVKIIRFFGLSTYLAIPRHNNIF
jgi:hypothetical protein